MARLILRFGLGVFIGVKTCQLCPSIFESVVLQNAINDG